MQFMSLMGLGTIFRPQKSRKSTGGASAFWAACVCSRVCTWSRRWFCGAPFSALYLSLASFWRQLTQHLLLWILILDIDYMRRVEALKCFGQPYISSVLLSYSITCSFQFTMWTVWASLQRFTCSNTCLSVCEGLSQYSHAEGTRGCANTTRDYFSPNWFASASQIPFDEQMISSASLRCGKIFNVSIPRVCRFQSLHALLLMCQSFNTAH